MPTPLSMLVEALGERLDEDLLPSLYAAASVPTATVRQGLREAGLAFLDPETGSYPGREELELTVGRVIRQSRTRATALGTVAGLGGMAAVPPELAAFLVHTLRLAQRLAVVYGFDPETDAGKLVLWRALAAAYEVELPAEAPLGSLKVSELPDLVRKQLPARRPDNAWLVRLMASRARALVTGRMTRLVPGLGAGLAGWRANRRVEQMGRRMAEVYLRGADLEPFLLDGEEDAVEVSR